MKGLRVALVVGMVTSALGFYANAQEGPLNSEPPKESTPQAIIAKFTAKEKEFKNARKRCTYRQSIKMQALTGEKLIGEYEQVADVTLDDSGKKVKNIVFAP